MKLIIARHGETESNNEDLLQGQLDGELSARGCLQAEALSEALRDENIDIIYSSDLKRGSDTADVIAGYHDIPLCKVKEARERHFGIYGGTNRTAFYGMERALEKPWEHRPQDGESFVDLYKRAKAFLAYLYGKHAGQCVLLVSHGDYARMCLGILMGKTVWEACTMRQTNSCINVILVGAGLKGDVEAINSIEHLPEDLRSDNKSDV